MESKDLIEGEVKVTSEIKANKIYTLSKRIVFEQVNTEIMEDVRGKINELIT